MSGRPVFSGSSLDRVSAERHDPAWVDAQRHHQAAACVAAAGDAVVLDGDRARLLRRPLPHSEGERGELLLLGLEAGVPLFGTEATHVAHPALTPLREAGMTLSPAEAGLAAYLVGLTQWHRRHAFCPRCGGPTVPEQGGLTRRCTRCRAEHFPRTDPAVIMLVEAGDRILLGRRSAWPAGRYSILAGFVSPGESLEEAVRREVWEESGIVVRGVRFVASQPWPFPSSLMIGFTADSPGGEPCARDGELADVRWFTREEVLRAHRGESDELVLPPSVSIAYLMITRWAAAAARA